MNLDQENDNLQSLPEKSLTATVYELLQTSDYDKALEAIDNFYKNSETHIRCQCDSLRAAVFERQGRYQEALVLYRSSSQDIELTIET